MRGREVCLLELGDGEVPTGGILVGDGSNARFGFNVRVYITDDDGDLVFRRGEKWVIQFKSSDVVQLELPFGVVAVQASVKRRLELFELFGTDLHIESAVMIGPDVFDAFLQVLDFQLAFQTDAKVAERRAFSLQGYRTELEAALIASELGLDRLCLLANLAGPGDSLLLAEVVVLGVSWMMA